MKRRYFVILILLLTLSACGKRIKLPTNIPSPRAEASDTTYITLPPAWTEAGGIPFDHPQDVHVGFDGYVYIADEGNNRVVEFDQAGNFIAQYEGARSPRSVSQDQLLRLLVTGGNTIYVKLKDKETFDSLYAGLDIYDSTMVVRPDTLIDTLIVPPDSMIIDTIFGLFDTTYIVDTIPTNYEAIAPDPRPTHGYSIYFVCDFRRDEISRFIFFESKELYYVGVAIPPGYELSKTRRPTGVFTYLSGDKLRLLFCQTLPYLSVQLLDGDNLTPLIPRTDSSNIYWEGTFGVAEDAVVDEYENIFVVDSRKNQVHKFSRHGVRILSFGKEGTGEKEFKNPKGIAYANKIVYVADTGNNRILRFMLSTDFPH
jgi:DNA-binding beta-propeller fold protein YncE